MAPRVTVDVFEMFDRRGQEIGAYVFFLSRFAEDIFPGQKVLPRMQQHALGFQPVAPGSARLLLIVLDRFRHRQVDDEADIRAVDAHAEGDGGDDQIALLRDESVLHAPPFVRRFAGVIGERFVAQRFQRVVRLIDILAAQAINDARLALVPIEDFADLLVRIAAAQYTVSQVRPVEIADEHKRINERQLLANILAHLLGRRRGVAVDAYTGEDLLDSAHHAIFGAEIVPPMADAMGLVNREGLDVGLPAQIVKLRHHQTFRRDEQQANGPVAHVLFVGGALRRREGAVELDRGDVARLQAVHLIFHERDERRDDDGGAAAQHGRRLVAERLAAAGGEHEQRIATIQYGPHRVFLQRAKRAVTPVLLHDGFQPLDHGEGGGHSVRL